MSRKLAERRCGWPVAGSVVTVAPPVPVATAEELADVAATVAARVTVGATVAAVVAVGATVAARVAVAEPVVAVLVPPVVLVLLVCAEPEPAVNAKTVRMPTTNTRSVESRLPTRAPTFLQFRLADLSSTANLARPRNHNDCGGPSVRLSHGECHSRRRHSK
jgi:hypothetical protein